MVRKTPVPVFHPHSYVAFGGVLNTTAGTPEIWQCGMRVFAHGETGTLHDHDAYLSQIQTPLYTWFQSTTAGQKFPQTARLDWIKANPINASGLYSDPSTHRYDYATGKLGQSTGPFVPDILCVCVSFKTAYSRGRAARGRMYLPNYAQNPTTAGSMDISTADATSWATCGAHLLDVIANAAGAQKADPIIASGIAGDYHPIVGVRCGTVMDVQRRRKSGLTEVYENASWTPP